MSPRAILVVEDNPITRKMVRIALESEGYEVLEAADGRSALELAREHRPVLVLQDYVLPDMDGFRLLEGLRSLPGGAELPVVVITGMVSQIDELRARAIGPTTVLPKPLEPSRLVEIVRGHTSSAAATLGKGRRVLLVDDELLGRKLAALRLRDSGFDVETAASAVEALRIARSSPPDAILSDVLMPGMDGFELCRTVREDERLARVPVILLSSAFVEEPDQQLALQMGASVLLPRTPDFGEAIDALAAALETGRAPAVAPPAAELAALHTKRLQVQLEKQLARNEALLRQGAIQAAALSVVRGLAMALANPRDVPSILADVLVHCLDSAGLSTGLLYLAGPDGRLRLQAQTGLPSAARLAAARSFGHPLLFDRILDAGEPVAYVASADEQPARDLLSGLGRTSCLIVPFLVGPERVGLLVLGGDSQEFSEPVWIGFGRALAVQFGQTIALGRFLARGAASEARYRSLMEQANDAILLVDAAGIIEANQKAEALLGRPRAELVGHAYEEFVAPDEREQAATLRSALLAGGATRRAEEHLVRPDGSRVPVEVARSLARIGDEALVLLIARDVTERRRAQDELRQTQHFLQSVFETLPGIVSIYDLQEGRNVFANQELTELLGYTREQVQAMGSGGIANLLHPDDRTRVASAYQAYRSAEDKRVYEVEYRMKHASGAWRWLLSRNVVFERNETMVRQMLGIAVDVTDQRRTEDLLQRSQRVEAIGRLAGGVAHDFNNILGVIMGYGEMAQRQLPSEHPVRPRVDQMLAAAQRAAELTKQLLGFSRRQVLHTRAINLNDCIRDVDKMLGRLIPESVTLVVRGAPSLGTVKADPGQIEQIILNLVVNARDAMPEGGSLTIETANADLDEAYAAAHTPVMPGRYAMLAVSDTGIGMDAETRLQIFEPFFTTKAEGEGTGLGLATVYGIVKQSGGYIWVYSEPGRGTTFKVYLPRVDEAPQAVRAATPAAAPPRGHETILLVEDAEALREVIRETLEERGYTLLVAAEGEEALDLARQHQEPIELLLTDVVMPKLGGADLAKRLKALRPGIRVLHMSGYTNGAISQGGVLAEGVALLEKPFTSDKLARVVREVLDRPPESGGAGQG